MLKTKPPLKILSVIPGSRYLGIIVFYDTDIRDWRIKDIRGGGIKNKIKKTKRILSGFIDRYDPQILAIKEFDSFRSSSNLNNLTRQIKDLAREKGLTVYQCALAEIKGSISLREKINKNDLAQIMISQYPELAYDFKKEQHNKNSYYIKEFEAAALASTCFYKFDNHN